MPRCRALACPCTQPDFVTLSMTQPSASTWASSTPFVENCDTTTSEPQIIPVSRNTCAFFAVTDAFTEPSACLSNGIVTSAAGSSRRATHDV